jgi:hypothetical protein
MQCTGDMSRIDDDEDGSDERHDDDNGRQVKIAGGAPAVRKAKGKLQIPRCARDDI